MIELSKEEKIRHFEEGLYDIETLREKIVETLDEIKFYVDEISGMSNPSIRSRVEAYWYTAILNMLNKPERSIEYTLSDTINEISEEILSLRETEIEKK